MQKRKNYFIKKRFQANFFVRFGFLLLIEAALIAALFMYVSRNTLTTAYHGTELTIQKTNVYFLVSFILITLIVGIAIGIVGMFVFMYLSHRLGGPLYRFEKSVEEAKRGNFAQRVNLRKTDQLIELKDKINSLLEELDMRISDVKGNVEKALETIHKDKNGSSLEKIKEIFAKVKTSLNYFKTSK